MTEQEKTDPYETMLNKFEDFRKDARHDFLKMLGIMLAALTLVAIGNRMALSPMIAKIEKISTDIVDIKVEQGKEKERDYFIEKIQDVEIAGLIEACGKKKYICKK